MTGPSQFRNPPDFEDPADSDGDNVYEITVTASVPGMRDGSLDVRYPQKVCNRSGGVPSL